MNWLNNRIRAHSRELADDGFGIRYFSGLWSIFVVEMHNSIILDYHAKSFGTNIAELYSREIEIEA